MYVLPCPHCETDLTVTPARAGDDLQCPQCEQTVRVPSLGKIKNLPRTDGMAAEKRSVEPARNGILFALCGAFATIALIIAGFCGIRYSLIEIPVTEQEHIDSLKKRYQAAGAAELIREYEEMEKFHLELATPYKYKRVETEKQGWGRNAILAAGTSGLLLLGAAGLLVRDRKSASKKRSD